MPVEVLGNYPTITRKRSGIYSLDVALSTRGELGVPLRTIMELYGYTNSGKSTLAYYLAGVLTGKGNIAICDLETADLTYIHDAVTNTGLDGSVYVVDVTDDKGKPITHEDMLTMLSSKLSDEEICAVILDSVGGIIPAAENKGDFGEAFMGKRAKLVAQVSRNFVNSLRIKSRPSMAIIINHVHSIIGGRGHSTIGGEALKFLSAMRIMIWPQERFTVDEDDTRPIGFLVSGKTEKFRYGGAGREFQYYIVPGYGVHVGASAMFDCFALGLAKRDTTVKLDGKSMGYLKKDFLFYAEEGKQRKFEPFIEALKKHEEESRMKNVEEVVEDLGNGLGEVVETPKKKRGRNAS